MTKDAWVSQVSGSDAIKRQSLNVKVPKERERYIYIYIYVLHCPQESCAKISSRNSRLPMV